MKALAALAALLACAGCGRQGASSEENVAEMNAEMSVDSLEPEPIDAAPPPPTAGAPGPDGAGAGPTNSFIVCPGHPRCPKAGESALPEVVD